MATVHHERQRHSSFITTIPTITASLQEEPNSPLLDTAIASHLLRILWNHPVKNTVPKRIAWLSYISDKIQKNSEFEVNMHLNASTPTLHTPSKHWQSFLSLSCHCRGAKSFTEPESSWGSQETQSSFQSLAPKDKFLVASARTVD